MLTRSEIARKAAADIVMALVTNPETLRRLGIYLDDSLSIPGEETRFFHREALTSHVHGQDERSIRLSAGKYRLYFKNINTLPLSHTEVEWIYGSGEQQQSGRLEVRNTNPSRLAVVNVTVRRGGALRVRFRCKTATDIVRIGISKVFFGIERIE
jgi:hypothetical protein